MLFAFRVLWLSLALSLSLISLVLALPRPPTSTPSSPQSADAETVREFTEKYGLAIAAGDLEALRQLWHPPSPHLAARLRHYQYLFANTRIEFIKMDVTRLEVTGERAISHLTMDERHLDKKPGSILSAPDAYHGACRSLEWSKTGAGRKIEREFSVQDELAARLEAAASAQERDELLEKEQAFVTDTLVGALVTRGHRHSLRGDDDAALRCYRLERAVAEKIGDPAGIAGSWLNIGVLK
jgi:hypothetical protein